MVRNNDCLSVAPWLATNKKNISSEERWLRHFTWFCIKSRNCKLVAKTYRFFFFLLMKQFNILLWLHSFQLSAPDGLTLVLLPHSSHCVPGRHEWHLWTIRYIAVVKAQLPCVTLWSWHLSRIHVELLPSHVDWRWSAVVFHRQPCLPIWKSYEALQNNGGDLCVYVCTCQEGVHARQLHAWDCWAVVECVSWYVSATGLSSVIEVKG